ncbi:hypothetical protein FI667_g8898, partial [Globisporangium splendens]
MFASAKKMLVFMAPDDSMDGKNGGEEVTQRATKAMGAVKRAYRKPLLDAVGPPSRAIYPPSRSQQSPSALELLSRSAPPASLPYPLAIGSLQVHIPAKRLQADPPYYTAGRPAEPITMTFPKRKYSKVSNSRTSFSDRKEAVAAMVTEAPLPPIEATLEAEFSSVDDAEPPLSKLCRSLLHAAMAVDSGADTMNPGHSRVREQSLTVPDQSEAGGSKEPNTPRDHLSPHTEDLLCVEDIETPVEKPTATSSLSQEEIPPNSNRDNTRQNATSARKIAAAQERAVLQEVSVWLRNMTTASLPNGNSASRHF